MKMKKVLNVGGRSKDIQLPPIYTDFNIIMLDIDPEASPDILCDARKLTTLDAAQFDAIYCAHNLEHYYRHDVSIVLAGFLHVLKDDGFINVLVPDINEVMRVTIERGLDIDDVLYQSKSGPIMVLDVLYGWSIEIEETGKDFMAHKTGFTEKSLGNALHRAGFPVIYGRAGNFEINTFAFKKIPDQATRKLCNLPDK